MQRILQANACLCTEADVQKWHYQCFDREWVMMGCKVCNGARNLFLFSEVGVAEKIRVWILKAGLPQYLSLNDLGCVSVCL